MTGYNAGESAPPLDNRMTYAAPQPNAALVVGPNDLLVLSYRPPLYREQVAELMDRIREFNPHLAKRTLVVAADRIAVVTKFDEVGLALAAPASG